MGRETLEFYRQETAIERKIRHRKSEISQLRKRANVNPRFIPKYEKAKAELQRLERLK